MPIFSPPLSYSSKVSSVKDHDLHLQFFLTFETDSDFSGQWEIWTNLPVNSQDDSSSSIPETWKAIPFVDWPQLSINARDSEAEHSLPSLEIAIPLTPMKKAQLRAHKTAFVCLPRGAEGVYEYTFRRTLPDSSEIEWLGREGANGVVEVSLGSTLNSEGQDWSHDLAGQSPDQSAGFGLAVRSDEGQLGLEAFVLPSGPNAGTLITVNLVHKTLLSSAFSKNVPIPASKDVGGQWMYWVYARDGYQPLHLDSGSSRPTAVDVRFSKDDNLNSAFRALSSSVGPNDIFEIQYLNLSQPELNDQATALIITPKNEGTIINRSLVVFAAASKAQRSLDVDVTPFVQDSAPLAVQIDRKGIKYLPPRDSPTVLRFNTPPEEHVAQVINLIDFVSLHIPRRDSTLWVAGLGALRVQHGRSICSRRTSEHGFSAVEVKQPDHNMTDEDPVENKGLALELDSPGLHSPNNPNGNDSNNEIQTYRGLWFMMGKIGRILQSIVSWLFGSSRHTSNSQSKRDPLEESDDDDDSEGYETRTPVDENTPLLRSPQISRPQPEFALTPPLSPSATPTASKLIDELSSISGLTALAPVEGPQAGAIDSELRSHICFTFSGCPPFTLLMPPGTLPLTNDIEIKWRHNESSWTDAPIKFETNSDRCSEIHVGIEGDVSGWEVRLEDV